MIKPSTRSEAIAVLLAIGAGVGVGYALMRATGSNLLGIMMAAPVATLVNNYVRNRLRRGGGGSPGDEPGGASSP